MTISASATKNQFNNSGKPGETSAEMGKSKVTVKNITLLRKNSIEEEK